ncbi:MAG: hypothetical protein JSV88_09480 [Candidatus Aminicenantes bacterium]|nr:MAG: hypothetical protein JSV88_09480 [Candidatus Aminicenantes bacterium]
MRRELGNFERAQVITNEHYPFNAVIILCISNGPSEETLREVLKHLRRRHPLLSVHIHKEKGRYFFVSEAAPAIPLKVVERQNSEHWQQVVEQELNREVDIFKGPLIRLTYLIGPVGPGKKNESEIVITFQHAVIDASSTANFLHELLSLCEKIETHGSVEGFNNLEPLPPAEAFFPSSFQGMRRKWHNFLFILRQIGDEFLYRLRTRSRRKAPIHAAGRGKILTITLTKDTSNALNKHSRKKRITINNLFNAAILMAVHKHLYDGQTLPLRHFNFADLRPYLTPPLDTQYLGSYFSMMRFTVGMKENPKVWELARKINDITYTSFKRGDKFCANLLSPQMMQAILRFKSFRMAVTALSFTGFLMLEKHYGAIEVRDIHAFVSNFVLGPEYTAQTRWFDGRFYWDILYLDSDMDYKQAKVIAEEIRTILESAAEEES